MRVRGDAPVLWRTTGQTQIGVEPGRSLVLTGLTAAEQQLLDHLPRRMSPDDVYRASRRCRVPLPRAQDLLGRLRAEGVLRGAGSRPTTPEEQYWERLVHSPRSRAVRLRAKRVALFGSGPLAHELAALAAHSLLAPASPVVVAHAACAAALIGAAAVGHRRASAGHNRMRAHHG